MPLDMAPTGRTLTITKVTADERTAKRLSELGIAAGQSITVAAASAGGVTVVVGAGRRWRDGKVARGELGGRRPPPRKI